MFVAFDHLYNWFFDYPIQVIGIFVQYFFKKIFSGINKPGMLPTLANLFKITNNAKF
jgi:hypothetical protein